MKRPSASVIFIRFVWIPVSLFLLFNLASTFLRSANSIAYSLAEDSLDLWLDYKGVESVVFALLALSLFAHLSLEILGIESRRVSRSRLLTHFRYGPLVVTILFLVIVPIFDVVMVEVSRYRISSYIFQKSESTAEPDIVLHNPYRHWCGNGASAAREYLYFDTSASGITNEDPYVRARSLLMTKDVRDFLNRPDPRYKQYLERACGDSSEVVVMTAEEILSGSDLSCAEAMRFR